MRLVQLYPPSWRARYEPEFEALLDDTPPGPRRTIDAVLGAARAWLRPPRHLHSPDTRMRSSISVVLHAWTVLVAGSLVFAQLTEDASTAATRPLAHGAFSVFRAAGIGAVALLGLGTLPLALSLAARARRQHRRDVLIRLASPVLSITGFAAVLILIVTLVPRSRTPGVGIGVWFLPLLAAGLLAGYGCAAGPADAVRRLAADERATRLAVVASAASIALLVVGTTATTVYALQLPPSVTAAQPGFLGPFLAIMATALSVAIVSAMRGLRAAV